MRQPLLVLLVAHNTQSIDRSRESRFNFNNFFRQTKYTNNFEDGMGNLARPSFSFFVFPSLNFRFHKVFEDLLNSWRLVSRGLVACLKNPQSKSRPHFLLIRGPVDVGRTVGLVRRGRELRINSNNSNS